MTRISAIIDNEVQAFKNSTITIVDNYKFNQYDTLAHITLYANDRFWDNDDDTAIFWNLAKTRLPHFVKNIDLDTKDLMPYGVGNTNYFQAWVLKMKLQNWLEKSRMALKLNALSSYVSLYGSAIWKITTQKGEKQIDLVNLRNIYFDPTVANLCDSSFVNELHLMDEAQIRAKGEAWNDIEKIFDNATQHNNSEDIDEQGNSYTEIKYYEIWERWGEVKQEDGKYKYMHHFVCGEGEDEVILFEEESSIAKFKKVYQDFHVGEYEGRWLRVGVVERLFKLQRRVNQLVNQNADTTEIASLLLFRTQDPNTNGNLLQSLESGDIINSADMQQVAMDNRSIGVFLNEMALIEKQANDLCLTPQVIRGEALPSGTPFRSLAAITNAGKSTFRFIKESIGETIGYVIKEEILPQLAKEWNKGELLEISEDINDIRLYDDAVLRLKKGEFLQDKIAKGEFVTDEQLAEFETNLLADIETKGRKIKVPKNFFNFEYGIKLNVTNEGVDKAQRNDTFGNVLPMIQSDPTIQNNPYFRQYVEENGITPIRMTAPEQHKLQQQVGAAAATAATAAIKPKQDALAAQIDTQ